MSNSESNSADEKVVIEQRLLKIDEVFVYRIPPMRSADGHRAEDWNLAQPLAACALALSRRDDALRIDILARRPKPGGPAGAAESYSFARSEIGADPSNPGRAMEHWVAPAADSSRYFAVRIADGKTGREAFIGVGFRERSDATNFRMCMEDYINSLRREEKAAEMRRRFERSLTTAGGGEQRQQQSGDDDGGDVVGSAAAAADAEKIMLPLPKSSLSLKEGEKMHINIKGKGPSNKPAGPKPKKGTVGSIGLKKPPPPPDSATPVSDSSVDEKATTEITADNKTPTTATTPSDADVDWGDFEG